MNVIDKYKEWQVDLIKEEVQKNAFPYAALMENWGSDYNLSTLIRNANAFGAKEVFYLKEKKKWDTRGAVGTHHYSNVQHLSSYEEVEELKKRYKFVAIENGLSAARTLANYEWKADTLLVFGEEGNGLSKQILAMCEDIVYIPQYGSVRSLNVGTTSGIIMNDLVSKTIYNVGLNNGRSTERGNGRPQTQTSL
tara:strand:+ start:207 stop:788 length:582 start_codon:yes stop_codon:yes gene_type:complete